MLQADGDEKLYGAEGTVPPVKKPRLILVSHGEAEYQERPVACNCMAACREDCSARDTALPGPCNDPSGGLLQDAAAATNDAAALHEQPQAKCVPFPGHDLDEDALPELPDTSTKKVRA